MNGRAVYSNYAWVTPEKEEKARRLVKQYGLTLDAIAERFSWDTTTARRVLGPAIRAKTSPEMDAAIIQHFDAGLPVAEISEKVGCSKSFVENTIRRVKGIDRIRRK
jgi:DNA-directed RNA polymerase specialized sigma24 family protein